MKRESQLKRRRTSLHNLRDTVTAMKSLAAQHYRQIRQSLQPARVYRERVMAVADRLGLELDTDGRADGILLITSDLALDGDYTARLTEAALRCRQACGASDVAFYRVGRRADGRLKRAGVAPSKTYRVPLSEAALDVTLLQLTQDVLDDFASGRLTRLAVISARSEGPGRFTPSTTIALAPWTQHASSGPPCRYDTPAHRAAVVVRELFYVNLYTLFLEAMAAEQGVRLVAADAADRWLDGRLERLQRDLAACRRENATRELLEIVTGARAMSPERNR